MWVIDLDAGEVTVHRQPQGNRYTAVTSHHDGDVVNPEVSAEIRVAVNELLDHQQEAF